MKFALNVCYIVKNVPVDASVLLSLFFFHMFWQIKQTGQMYTKIYSLYKSSRSRTLTEHAPSL